MCENKSKRLTSVTHYPPAPLSTNRSIWHNSQQTSLWLQMGVDGREVKVIPGKDTKGTTDLSHAERKEIRMRKKIPSTLRALRTEQREIPVSYNLGHFPALL